MEGAAPPETQVYADLRRLILTGELAPGAAFSQVQLSEQLGVSRTPLREAVRRLQSEGLVHSEHNRKVVVAPLTTADFEQLYAMRITLDSLAVQLSVPRLTTAELDAIAADLELATAAAGAADAAGYRGPHRRFHMGLSQHAGVRLLTEIEDLWDHAERYRLLYAHSAGTPDHLFALANRDHAGILAAARAHDATLCARRLAGHLARTALMTIASTDHRHDPAVIRTALAFVGDDDTA